MLFGTPSEWVIEVREIVRANPWLGGRLRKGFGRHLEFD